jgi:hypothetical protein
LLAAQSIEKVGKTEEHDARVDPNVSFVAAVGNMLQAPRGGQGHLIGKEIMRTDTA